MGLDPITMTLGASAIGAGIGALGKKKQTSTATSEPWGPAQPFLHDTMRQAQNLYRYGPNTVPPFSAYTRNGMGRAAQVAGQGVNPIVGQASGVLGDTLSGSFLSGNPYLEAQIESGSRDIADSVNSVFSGAGRYGSGAHRGELGDRIADFSSDMRYQNYENERQNMLRAAQLAPVFAGQQQELGLFGPQTLLDLGSRVEAKDQDYRREPYDMLSWYNQIINGTAGLGGTQTQTQPGGSKIAGALGGALTGAKLMGLF